MSKWEDEEQARKFRKKLAEDFYHESKLFDKTNAAFYDCDRTRSFDEKDKQTCTDAIPDLRLSSGGEISEFESEFASFLGGKYVHLVNSAQYAHLIAFAALTSSKLGDRQINRGDEVITAACAMPEIISPILQYGAVPVFVDITIPEYNIDVKKLEEAYSSRTKAVIVSHTLGNPFNLKAVKEFCERHDLWLIEDNCGALGSKYTLYGVTRYTGSFGDITTSSFYPSNHFASGEFGCVYSNDPLLNTLINTYIEWGHSSVCKTSYSDEDCISIYSNIGQLSDSYEHEHICNNAGGYQKISDLQAAAGVEQLKNLPSFIKKRRHNWKRLRCTLEPFEDSLILPEAEKGSVPSWSGFLISLRENCALNRDKMICFLESKKIKTRTFLSGNIILHPCFDEIRNSDAYRVAGSLENCNFVLNNTFWVSFFSDMTDDTIDYISDAVKEAVCGRWR